MSAKRIEFYPTEDLLFRLDEWRWRQAVSPTRAEAIRQAVDWWLKAQAAPSFRTIWQPHATFGGVLDVSHHNGDIRWGQVPESFKLIFIKATQGDSFQDPKFTQNCEGAYAGDRLVVPYHFLTEHPVQAQLDNLLTVIGDWHDPVMIDWEPDPSTGRRAPIATMEAFGAALAKAIGRAPVAYHGMYDLSSPAINAWPWMVPKYGPQPRGPHWLLWQDRPNLVVPGILSLVDHSVFAGTAGECETWYKTGTMPQGF